MLKIYRNQHFLPQIPASLMKVFFTLMKMLTFLDDLLYKHEYA